MNNDSDLPENWAESDAHNCFYEYVALVRQQWLAGERELPRFFRSARHNGAAPAAANDVPLSDC